MEETEKFGNHGVAFTTQLLRDFQWLLYSSWDRLDHWSQFFTPGNRILHPHTLWTLLSHHLDGGFGHMTGFSLWHVSECDQSIGLKMSVVFGLVSWAAVIAMLVQGECGVTLSPTHSLWEKQRLVVVNCGVFMWSAGEHYCGNGWLIPPQGHLQAGLHSPTSPAPFPTTQLQPNQSIQYPMKLGIPSHSHLPNLVGRFPSLFFLFPECPSCSPFTLQVYASHTYPSRQLKDPPPLEAFFHCPSPPHPSVTSLCWALLSCQPMPFMGCWAHSDQHHHWLNLSKWISMSFICLWFRSFLLSMGLCLRNTC